jgi:hypothetical protein
LKSWPTAQQKTKTKPTHNKPRSEEATVYGQQIQVTMDYNKYMFVTSRTEDASNTILLNDLTFYLDGKMAVSDLVIGSITASINFRVVAGLAKKGEATPRA